MHPEWWWGVAAFGFFLFLWAVLPSRLKRNVQEKVHHRGPAETGESRHTSDGSPEVAFPAFGSGRRVRKGGPDGVVLESVAGHSGNGGARHVIRGTFDGFAFALPMHRELRRVEGLLCEVFSVDLLGIRLTCSSLTGLPESVVEVLQEVAYGGRLPRLALRVRGGLDLWPVYRWDGAWRVMDVEGPVIEAQDLNTLGARWAHYLGVPTDGVEVLRLTSDLRWAAPVGWLVGDERRRIPVYVADGALWTVDPEVKVPRTGEAAWWRLLEAVESALGETMSLVLTGLPEAFSQEVLGGLTPVGTALRYYEVRQGRWTGMTVPVLHNGRFHVVACPEGDASYAVYAAPDPEALRACVATVLWRQGRLADPGHLRMVSLGGVSASFASTY